MSNLDRFIKMHELYYDKALQEIKEGYKQTHWIWYIFPEIKGLGISATAQYYEIKDIKEARAYLENKLLREHLIEISNALLEIKDKNIEDIMSYPDNLKLKSSMTLFNYIVPNTVFKKVLDKYYDGEIDEKTINILRRQKED